MCVDDVIAVNRHFAASDTPVQGIFNVGTGTARTFNDMARLVVDQIGGAIEYIPFPADLEGRYQHFTQADLRPARGRIPGVPPLHPDRGGRAPSCRHGWSPALTVDPNARLLDLASASLERSLSTKSRLDRVALPALVEAWSPSNTPSPPAARSSCSVTAAAPSDAQHIAAELVGRYVKERRSLPAIALNTDTSALTAIGNDYGYEHVFSGRWKDSAAPTTW